MKIRIFTHCDLDGIGCAILAYLAFGRENVEVEYCNYDDVDGKIREFYLCGNPEEYDAIYITDISVNEEVAEKIDSLVKTGQNWKLFDHHATALWLNCHEWCEVLSIDPYTTIKTSGTEIFWRYLVCDKYMFWNFEVREKRNLEQFVKIVRDYDTWRWKDLGEEGLVCKQVNDLFYIYGREAFIDWAIHRIQGIDYISPLQTFPCFSATDRALLEQKQREIDIYVEFKNKQLVEKIDQFGHAYGVVFADRFVSELGDRLCELHPELDYVAMIDICSGKVSYRTVREDLDVGGTIAHSNGGGGHPKAAGSTFDGCYMREMVTHAIFPNCGCLTATEMDCGSLVR